MTKLKRNTLNNDDSEKDKFEMGKSANGTSEQGPSGNLKHGTAEKETTSKGQS